MINRRTLLATGAAAALIRPRPLLAQTTGVTPVFINWNPWYQGSAVVTRMYPNVLSKPQYQFRAPWFCAIKGTERIFCQGTQATMDLEIQAAANAGIKAWAWNWYGADAAGGGDSFNPDLQAGWAMYNSSSIKAQVKWCGFPFMRDFGSKPWSNTAAWQANCNLWVSYFQQANYLKVGGRPVLFVFWSDASVASHFGGSNANVTTSFNYLRSQSSAAGAGDPYIVSIGSPYGAGLYSWQAAPIMSAVAVSNYAPRTTPAYGLPSTFANLNTKTSEGWDALSTGATANGLKVVPNAIMGWDIRPIVELPPIGAGYTPYVGHTNYYARGTNVEIANHLQATINYIGAHQPQCDSKLMLVYAWNECAEGGTTGIPTIGDPPTGTPPTTAMLSAIKPVLTAAA